MWGQEGGSSGLGVLELPLSPCNVVLIIKASRWGWGSPRMCSLDDLPVPESPLWQCRVLGTAPDLLNQSLWELSLKAEKKYSTRKFCPDTESTQILNQGPMGTSLGVSEPPFSHLQFGNKIDPCKWL